MSRRVLVLGLDCAAPELVLDRWRGELPALASVIERGQHGVLRSCDPPITVPAWSVMASSRSPGALGIYGFRNRASYGYADLRLADSRAVRVPRVWDVLGARDRPVVVLGVPGTYPPRRVNGALVGCFLTPDPRTSRYTHPPELAQEIEDLVGEYLVDVPDFRTDDKERLLRDLETMTERRFAVAEHLMATRPWDLFWMVEMGTDRIHHGFWRHLDPDHRLHEPDSPYADAILGYYKRLDARIARLLERVPEDTAILVVSDHGAQRMDGGICVNEWLRREGLLALKEEPAAATRLTPDMVDWPNTTAWGEGGYYCRLFLNVRGREPEGRIAPEDLHRVRAELKARLEALGDEHGTPIGTVAHTPEDLYPAGHAGIAPDLMVYFGDLSWRSIGTVGGGAIHVAENDTGPDDANHAHEGLYVVAAEGVAPGPGPQRDIRDVAPTILRLLDEPVPPAMEGAPIVG